MRPTQSLPRLYTWRRGGYRIPSVPPYPYLWATVVAEFVLMLTGIIVALQQDWAERRRRLVLGAFCVVGLIGMGATLKTAQKSATTSERLSQSVEQLKSASKKISHDEKLNAQLQEQLLKQTATIAELSRENISTLTGGNSFCYLTFSNPRQGGVAMLMAVEEGKFPLHDVEIRMVDLEAFSGANQPGQQVTFQSSAAGSTTFRVAAFAPNSAQVLAVFSLGSSDSRDFNVFFSAVNGFWTENLRIRKVDGAWRQAIRVETQDARPRVLFQRVEPGFPKAKGKVDWGR
jgi:hypothetical protein